MASAPDFTNRSGGSAEDKTPASSAPAGDSYAELLPSIDGIDILNSISEAYIFLGRDWRILYANREACRLHQKPAEDFVGRIHWEEWPEAAGTELEIQFRQALERQTQARFEHHYVSTDRDVWLEIAVYPTNEGLGVFYRDISERKLTEEALRASEEQLRETQARLQGALSAGGVITWTLDLTTSQMVANDEIARIYGISQDHPEKWSLDTYLQAVHPEDRPGIVQEIETVVAQGGVFEREYRVVLQDGSLRWLSARGKGASGKEGKATVLTGVIADITDRVKREQREHLIIGLADRARPMTEPNEVIADAVTSVGKFLGVARCVYADIDIDTDQCTIPVDYCATDRVASMAGTFPISAYGPYLVGEYAAGRTVAIDDVHAAPDRVLPDHEGAYDAIECRAFIAAPVLHSARLVSVIAIHSTTPRHWEREEVALLQTVVERTWFAVEVLRQRRAIAREAAETSRILESITDAFFALDREWRFTYLNDQAERLLLRSREELLGKSVWEEFPEAVGSTFEQQYRRAAEQQTAVDFEEFYPPLDSWFEVRAYPSDGGLSVYFHDCGARKQAEMDREALLADQRARAEQEALLNRIGQSFRLSANPEKVQENAANILFEALAADRCYIAIYDLNRGVVQITHERHRPDLRSVKGTYPFGNTTEMFHELYHGSHTSVISDAYTAEISPQTLANMQGLNLRARVSVALVDTDGRMATLTAAMSDAPREWTKYEIALIEAVASQLRATVEIARVQQREHRIAEHLQDALQPALPSSVPGLTVGQFSRPALEEAAVGGDFFDVFPLDKDLYALVVGDVSGKGLAAAQQLALVRNSLRTTLYLYRDPAQAAATLNTIVTTHELLAGFVTAFVGVYDAASGVVTYCSCGHEPGLVRRATGELEELTTTGPPLGVAENAIYDDLGVTLTSGDSLLLYTDGLSEAGPDRSRMLGTHGLIGLFSGIPRAIPPQEQAEAIAEQVRDYSDGIFRDDVAILLVQRQ